MNRQTLVQAIQLSTRAAVSAAVALAIASALGLQYPIYAFIAAVIVTELTPAGTRELGLRRAVATVVGAALGASLVQVLGSAPWAIGLGVLAAMLLAHAIRAQAGARVAGYTCGLVMLTHAGDAWAYAYDRMLETLIGIAVASALSFVPKLLGTDPAADGGAPTAT